jgi:hypothetical protein
MEKKQGKALRFSAAVATTSGLPELGRVRHNPMLIQATV